MKKIGLIGGLSPESTAHYYEILCREFNRRFGGLNFPQLTLESLNLQELVSLFEVDDWYSVATILLGALERLERAGAEFAAILANTPHNAYERLRDRTPLPIVTIMDATADALVADDRRRVGLLGTRPTMEHGFFQKHFQSRNIETIVPQEAERRELDRIIWEELSHGVVKPESQAFFQSLVDGMVQQQAEATVLGCTELGMLVDDTSRALYDTTQLHADAILRFALGESREGQGT